MFGEIYLCQFPFTTGATSKPRPVLVLFEFQQDVIVCRITSVPRLGLRDVSLADWQHSGLAKASVARLDKLVTAEKSLLNRQLGKLSDADKLAVRSAWNRQMTL